MSKSLNKVELIGRLGRDPEVRQTQSGKKCACFSMATDESYTDKDGQKIQKTEWHRVVAWQRLAEIIEQWVRKGSLIFIAGKLATRSWDDNNGVKHYVTEVIANEMIMLGGGEVRQAPAEQAAADDNPFC